MVKIRLDEVGQDVANSILEEYGLFVDEISVIDKELFIKKMQEILNSQ